MRWSLNQVRNLENQDIMNLSAKELGQLDRFLTDVARKRLQHTKELGFSPAENALRQSGILTDNMHAIGSSDRDSLIARTVRLKQFTEMKTSTRKGMEHYIENKERITKKRGVSPAIIDVISELKHRGLYGQLVGDGKKFSSTKEVVEEIDIILDESPGITLNEAIERLYDEMTAFNQMPEDEWFMPDEEEVDELDMMWRELNNPGGL